MKNILDLSTSWKFPKNRLTLSYFSFIFVTNRIIYNLWEKIYELCKINNCFYSKPFRCQSLSYGKVG
jgi:hypothetical protein